MFPPDQPELTKQLFLKAEVDPKLRSTQLSLHEYGRLGLCYKELCDEIPNLLDYDYRSPKEAAIWRKNKQVIKI